MMRKLAFIILIVLPAAGSHASSSIAYERVSYRHLAAHTVTVNLDDPSVRVTVGLASGGAGRCESFRKMMNRTRPAAAITGTFFDTKTLIPTGDIALCGTVVHTGMIGSALCIDASNKAHVVPMKEGRRTDWEGYETVLCAGPTLVAGGKVAIGLKHEGFRRSLLGNSRRTAVGITNNGKLVLVCINRPTSLYDLAKLMIKINVKSALCLDGGSSTALYYQGGYFACPGRTLTNCLMVYSTVEAYNRAKTALAPARYFAKATGRTPMGAGPAESIFFRSADIVMPRSVVGTPSDAPGLDPHTSEIYIEGKPAYRRPSLRETMRSETVSFVVK